VAYLLHKTVVQNRGKGLSLDWRLFRIQKAHRAICNGTFRLMFRINRKSQHFETGKGCFLMSGARRAYFVLILRLGAKEAKEA
jgi:hypothetical protein